MADKQYDGSLENTSNDGRGSMAEDHRAAAQGLQQSVEKAVPDNEKLRDKSEQNPISQQIENATGQTDPQPGPSTLQGGDQVEQ